MHARVRFQWLYVIANFCHPHNAAKISEYYYAIINLMFNFARKLSVVNWNVSVDYANMSYNNL